MKECVAFRCIWDADSQAILSLELYTRGYPKLASNFTTQLILSINASSRSDFTNNKIIFQMFTEWLNVWLHLILLSQLIFSNNNTYFTIYMRFIVCIKVKRCY